MNILDILGLEISLETLETLHGNSGGYEVAAAQADQAAALVRALELRSNSVIQRTKWPANVNLEVLAPCSSIRLRLAEGPRQMTVPGADWACTVMWIMWWEWLECLAADGCRSKSELRYIVGCA